MSLVNRPAARPLAAESGLEEILNLGRLMMILRHGFDSVDKRFEIDVGHGVPPN
jgi:hypothetical protein